MFNCDSPYRTNKSISHSEIERINQEAIVSTTNSSVLTKEEKLNKKSHLAKTSIMSETSNELTNLSRESGNLICEICKILNDLKSNKTN